MHRTSLVALAVLSLVGCEGEIAAPEELPSQGTLVVQATSATDFVYLTLDDGGSVVQVADPASSTEWDLAFRRYTVKVNGGVAGGGQLAAAAMGPNTNKTAEQIAALTAADATSAFAGVTAAHIASASFQEDGLFEDEGGSWFRFDVQAGSLVANPGAVWKLREAGGGFALFRVSAIQMAGANLQSLILQYRRQAAGGTLGTLASLPVTVGTSPVYVDLSSGSVVAGTGCEWDLVIDPSMEIDVNVGCSAGTFPLNGEDFNALTRADDAPEYGPFLSVVSGAIPNAISDASGLFWYGIEGNNRLWPTYNVFLIEDGDDVYKIQVTDYYSATGASGHITLRFEQIR